LVACANSQAVILFSQLSKNEFFLSFPMDEPLSFLLIQVCRAHRNLAESRLKDIGLHAGQEGVLLHLAQHEGITPSELATELCVEAPTITKTVQRLQTAEWVTRYPDPQDGRVSRLALTDKGRDAIQPIQDIWNSIEATLLQGFTLTEQALARRLVMQMLENLNTPPE
jgi:DNA-binding MarR family transcriptional regulator